MKTNRSMLYALSFVFVIAFVVIFVAKKTTVLNPDQANSAISDNLTETPPSTASTEATPNEGATQQGQPTHTQGSSDYANLNEGARIQKLEIEKTKELNQKNVALIRAQMLQEELISLHASIENDEKLLKEIEAQGTGADDYRYIESNLKKRRARLKELTQK